MFRWMFEEKELTMLLAVLMRIKRENVTQKNIEKILLFFLHEHLGGDTIRFFFFVFFSQ